MTAAAEHLASLGHRHVAYIGRRNKEQIVLEERLVAFRAACEHCGMELSEKFLPPGRSYSEDVDRHVRDSYNQLARHLDLPASVTGVMCTNDTLALALIALLRERGVRIPEEMSVVGFDDLHASLSWPALTTVSHMFHELGAKAVEVAMELAEEDRPAARSVVVPAQLVVRKSTGTPDSRKRSGSC
jgi:LacI family transcriptional regulator